MKTFQIDSTLLFAANFTAISNGALVDPTTVTLFLQPPNGPEQQFSFPGVVTKIGVGQYSYAFTPAASGTWTYNWQGTGAVAVTLGDKQFAIAPSITIPG